MLKLNKTFFDNGGKFVAVKFEFGGSFVSSWEWGCHESEVTSNLDFFVTFGTSLKGVWLGKNLIQLLTNLDIASFEP
jgi:hypothetical protein